MSRLRLGGLRLMQSTTMGLLVPDHRAAVQLICRGQGDFRIRSCGSGKYLRIREELARRESAVERYLDFPPERVEAIALNRIEDADEHLSAGEARIRLVDRKSVV